MHKKEHIRLKATAFTIEIFNFEHGNFQRSSLCQGEQKSFIMYSLVFYANILCKIGQDF